MASTARRRRTSTRIAKLSAPRASRRVLVLEDNDDVRRHTAECFASNGWDVQVARDVRTAVDLAIAHQPELIITELLLPDVRGYHFARTLRGVLEHDIKLVAVTRMPALVFEHALKAGFDHVLAKPFDLASVLQAISQ